MLLFQAGRPKGALRKLYLVYSGVIFQPALCLCLVFSGVSFVLSLAGFLTLAPARQRARAVRCWNDIFNLVWKFQSRRAILNFFPIFGPLRTCWLSWFSDPGCWSCPTSRASSRSLRACPWPSICFHGPSSKFLDLLPPASLPPMQKRDAQHMFLQHKGARTKACEAADLPVCCLYAINRLGAVEGQG